MKTARQILEQEWYKKTDTPFTDQTADHLQYVLDAMELYAAQFSEGGEKSHSVLHSIMRSHPVIHIEIEKSQDQHYIKVCRLSNFKYAVYEDQGYGEYNRVGEEYDTLEKALVFGETLA